MRKLLIVIGVFFSLGTYSQAVALTVWPDTGQNTCYDLYVPITCPQRGQPFYGQDAQYQGLQPSYTKLDANGNALDVSAVDWSMVRDNVTGLVWEVKTDDDTIHDKDNRYYWCNSNIENSGYCDRENNTEEFIDDLNNARFGGYDDWRLPSVYELATLLNSATRDPAINTTFFPNTSPNLSSQSWYWSSTIQIGNSYDAWSVGFEDEGDVFAPSKSYDLRSRAVRDGNNGSINKYVNNQNGTVTDRDTGLMWQQDPSVEVNGISGDDYLEWEEALAYVASLNLIAFAGHSDWRLPNRNELQTLVDYSLTSPAINTNFFPNTSSSFWSSTTVYGVNERALNVSFYNGYTGTSTKTYGDHAQAVRTHATFPLSVELTGNGSGMVTSTPAGISCGTDCNEMYESGTTVSLTATADSDSVFKGWAGACSGTGVCNVTMNQPKSVTANFMNPSLVNQGVLMLLLDD